MRITRRDFLLSGGMAAAGTVIGKPTRSSIGVRQLAELDEEQGGYTAESYVQEGMISMWDAMENVGWRTHDFESTTWKDLIGNNNISLTMGGGKWLPDALFLAKTPKTTGAFTRSETTYKQIEVVGEELTGNMSYDRHILISFGRTHSFVVGQNRIGFCVAHGVVGIKPTYPVSNRANVPFSVSVSYTPDNVPDGDGMFYNGIREPQSGSSITLGSQTGVLNNYGTYQADSIVHCIRLYSRALSAEEIAYNYMIDKARFNLP